MKAKGLGKGLNALLSEEALAVQNESDIMTVSINELEPNQEQPRRQFGPEELYELSVSIKEYGILQPILVRRKGNRYEIIAGERRYRAARLAKLTEVPIIIKEYSDQETLEVSIIENIQRENLNPMELAYGYSLLVEKFGYNQEQLAEKLGKSRPLVANVMRLLQLSSYVQEKVRANDITFGHARAILALKDEKLQQEVADIISEKELSVRATENYIQALLTNKPVKKEKKTETNPFYREIQENLQKRLGTKVMISQGKRKGKIEIEYYSDEELERIIEIVQGV